MHESLEMILRQQTALQLIGELLERQGKIQWDLKTLRQAIKEFRRSRKFLIDLLESLNAQDCHVHR